MVSVWRILYPYSTSRRLSKLALFGVLSLLTLYIIIFLRTAADIAAFKRQVKWYQSRVSKVASYIGENILNIMDMSTNLKTDWQAVDPPTASEPTPFMVYSAFVLENMKKEGNEVLIIGSLAPFSNLTELDFQCTFYYYYSGKEKTISTTASYQQKTVMPKAYNSLLIKCPLPHLNSNNNNSEKAETQENLKPTSVSVQRTLDYRRRRSTGNPYINITQSPNLLRIEYRSVIGNLANNQYQFTYSLCVLPTYDEDEDDDVLHFLEWLEYHKMMGVEEFTFYNMRIGPKIGCILNDLVDHGLYPQVNVYPWVEYLSAQQHQLKPRQYDRGISPSQLDCHFRHVGVSKYVLLLDSNEFLVPLIYNVTTLGELLEHLVSSEEEHEVGAYVFQKEDVVIPEVQDNNDEKSIDEGCSDLSYIEEDENGVTEFRKFLVCKKLWSNLVGVGDFMPQSNRRASNLIVPDRVKMTGYTKQDVTVLEGGFRRYRVSEKYAYIRHYWREETTNRLAIVKATQRVNINFAARVTDRLKYYVATCQLDWKDILENEFLQI